MVKYGEVKSAPIPLKPPNWWFILFFSLVALGFYGCIKLIFPSKEAQINRWFTETSHYQCEIELKEQLNDPESYKRIDAFIPGSAVGVSETNTRKSIVWGFRAKNSFGAYVKGSAHCEISKDNGGTTRAEILSR